MAAPGPAESVPEAIERARIGLLYREMRVIASHATTQLQIEVYAARALDRILEAFDDRVKSGGGGRGIQEALRSAPPFVSSTLRQGPPVPVSEETRRSLWAYSLFFGRGGAPVVPPALAPQGPTEAPPAPAFEHPTELVNVLTPNALASLVKNIEEKTQSALGAALAHEREQHRLGVAFVLESQSAEGIARRVLEALEGAHARWREAAGRMQRALNALRLAGRMRSQGTYAALGAAPAHRAAAMLRARGGGVDATPNGPGDVVRGSIRGWREEIAADAERFNREVKRVRDILGRAQAIVDQRERDSQAMLETLREVRAAYVSARDDYEGVVHDLHAARSRTIEAVDVARELADGVQAMSMDIEELDDRILRISRQGTSLRKAVSEMVRSMLSNGVGGYDEPRVIGKVTVSVDEQQAALITYGMNSRSSIEVGLNGGHLRMRRKGGVDARGPNDNDLRKQLMNVFESMRQTLEPGNDRLLVRSTGGGRVEISWTGVGTDTPMVWVGWRCPRLSLGGFYVFSREEFHHQNVFFSRIPNAHRLVFIE